jgi:cleavage and polyadenylation specificity factor subunit 3
MNEKIKTVLQCEEIPENKLEIIPLGGGNEVGRSCILLRFKGKNILLDCGIHPGFNGLNALPFFDEIEPGEIDILLVTHFHLDHMGALPYFLEKVGKV